MKIESSTKTGGETSEKKKGQLLKIMKNVVVVVGCK